MVKKVYLYGFPTVESPEAVTKFLEEYTGEGTVLSVNVLPPKDGTSRSSATVQFTTVECTEILLLLAEKKRLWYGESYLKAREWKRDMASRSKVLEELVTLHFGCKITEEKFSVLWTKSDVSVTFGMERKNVHLSFSDDFVEYKLELPSDTIFRIELHCPRGQFRKFLLIQLRGAPRIYKKDVNLASDNHWVREVDFTPSCCIEQSSSLCLELPLRCALPDLGKSFIHYIENEGQFVLKRGNTFSRNSALVPTLAPPLGIDLPYKILFKINSLVQHGCIPGQALDVDFYNLVDPKRIRIEYIECALDKLFNSKECCYEPVRWLLKQYIMYKACKRIPQSPAISLDEDLGNMHSVDLCPRTGSKFFFFPMATTGSTSSSTTSAQTVLNLNSDHSLNASQSSNAGNDFSSSSVSHFLSIRLDRTNYPLWLAQMSQILKGRKLMGIVDGTNPCPPCFLADSEGKLSDTVNPNYENWIAQEQTVLSWINESLTPSVLATVARSTSAFSTWRSLARRYASQSESRVLQLRSDLLRTFRGNLSISDYLYKINSIADNLALAGHPMTDEDLVSIIMNNVGPLYETTVSFAQARDTPITYDFLEALLLSTERRMADQHQGALDLSSQLTALHVSNSGRGRGRGRVCHQTWQPNNISVSV